MKGEASLQLKTKIDIAAHRHKKTRKRQTNHQQTAPRKKNESKTDRLKEEGAKAQKRKRKNRRASGNSGKEAKRDNKPGMKKKKKGGGEPCRCCRQAFSLSLPPLSRSRRGCAVPRCHHGRPAHGSNNDDYSFASLPRRLFLLRILSRSRLV